MDGRNTTTSGQGRAARARWLGLVAAAALGACGSEAPGEVLLAEARTYEPVGRPIRWGASDAERFGVSAKDFAMPSDADALAQGGFHYDVPSGWSELPPRQFRDINLRVAGNERAECYLTTLAGDGGGLAANVNRWRQQVSQPALSEEQVAALPRLPWLGKPAVFVDFEGTWTGMSGDAANSDWRLVGLLLVEPTQSRFLKMVGPSSVIAGEIEGFKALVASFHVDDGMGHAHGDAQPDEPPPGLPQGSSGALSWTAPAGWQRGPDKAMREVTFLSGTDGAVECYVTLLGGDGGGLLANINRWCAQMGSTPLAENELATLERAPMLDTEGVLIEISRGPSATAAEGQEYLIGALILRPGQSVFVKMNGPRAAVEAQRQAFLDFCRSLRANA